MPNGDPRKDFSSMIESSILIDFSPLQKASWSSEQATLSLLSTGLTQDDRNRPGMTEKMLTGT